MSGFSGYRENKNMLYIFAIQFSTCFDRTQVYKDYSVDSYFSIKISVAPTLKPPPVADVGYLYGNVG